MEQSPSVAVFWTLVIAVLALPILSEPLLRPKKFLNFGNTTNSADNNFDPNGAYTAEVASTLGTELELSISATNLPLRTLILKPYPMCVIYTRPYSRFTWDEYDRTETIEDDANPKFAKKITMPYTFEEKQVFRFKLYDRRNSRSGDGLDDRHSLGFVECNQGELVRFGSMRLRLKRVDSHGIEHLVRGSRVVITAEKLTSNFDEVVMELNGRGLDNMDWFGLSDPYIEIYKLEEKSDVEKDDTLAFRTEVIKDSLDPDWQRIVIPIRSLCNGEKKRSLKFVCWDWDRNKNPDKIGEFVTSLDEIERGQRTFELKHPKKMKKADYENSGTINVTYFEVVAVPSFADFIRGGLQILCSIAIDFTISNGDPQMPHSLHYRVSEGGLNQYEAAIISVVTILEDYDSDKLFPVYGFGARFGDNRVCYDFHVSLKPLPHCSGVEGVLDAYRECLFAVELAEPAYFAPVIRKVVQVAKNDESNDNYYILTILTCGDIMDMEQTESVISEGSRLPISIIIIGVGKKNFDLMKRLDKGDETRRDIVQFVAFEELKERTDQNTGLYLAKKVLAEVPGQVVSYMRSRGIKPREPIFTQSPSISYSDGHSVSLQQAPHQDSLSDNVPSQPQHQKYNDDDNKSDVPLHRQFSHVHELPHDNPPPPSLYTAAGSPPPHSPYSFDGSLHESAFQYPPSVYAPGESLHHQGFTPQSYPNFSNYPPPYSVGTPNLDSSPYILPSYLDPNNLPPHLNPNIIGLSYPYPGTPLPPPYIFDSNNLPTRLQLDLNTIQPAQTRTESGRFSCPHLNHGVDFSSSSIQSRPPDYSNGPHRY